jgi:hypothetical protein
MAYEAAELAEVFESESESEAAEAKQPLRKPSSAPSYKPRQPAQTTPNYVTQTQLEAALTRSDGKIKTLTDGVSTLNARIAALSAAAKKEADQRKKSVDTTGKDVNQKLQMLALLPLLLQPTQIKSPVISIPQTNIAGGAGHFPATTLQLTDQATGAIVQHLQQADRSTLDALLPLLLVTGVGSPGGGLSFGGDGSDSSMMLLALALAVGHK